MKVAVIGCGSMGNVHVSAFHRMPDVELTAVCDIVKERAWFAAKRTGAKAFTSFEDMLEQAEFDVISIVVPSYLHKEFAVKAARAGKHVISEKPASLTIADTKDMIAACEENQVRFFVGHVVRFFPDYTQLKQVVEQGKLGPLGVIHAKRGGSHPGGASNWFSDPEKSGGIIFDLMIHDIDYLRWTVGEVESVYAMQYVTEELETAFVTLEFQNGVVASLEGIWGYPGAFHTEIELAGSKGVARNRSKDTSSLSVVQAAKPGSNRPVVEIPESPGLHSPYDLELAHFISCIRTGQQAIVTGEDALAAITIASCAVQSAKSGKVVKLADAEKGA